MISAILHCMTEEQHTVEREINCKVVNGVQLCFEMIGWCKHVLAARYPKATANVG